MSLVLDPDGRLRTVIRATDHDGPLPFMPGDTLDVLLRHLAGSLADRASWDGHLADLRADPTTCLAFEIAVDSPEAAVRPLARAIVANPIASSDGSLESILLRVEVAHEIGGLPHPDEQRFRFLAETLPTMLWMARPDGSMEYMSPQWERFTGVPLARLRAEGYHSILHPDDVDKLGMLEATEGDDGEFTMAPFRLRQADGEYRWVQASIKTVRDEHGKLLRVVGTTTDVTPRRQAEEARRALTEQLRAALSVAEMGRYELNLGAGTATGDDRTCEILGIQPGGEGATVPADEVFSMVHAEDVAHVREATAAALTERSGLHVECRILRDAEDGPEIRWVSVLGRVEQGEGLASFRIYGVLGDITERRAEDAARLRSQKREAIGTLAGGIAHDFNNVISAIWSNASVAQTEIRAGISPETSIDEIRRGAERASDVVKRLLSFSREEEPVRVPFDLAAVAREACDLIRPTFAKGVELASPAVSALPAVLGSSSQLHQVVVNLVGNAGDAAADGGGHVWTVVDAIDLAPTRKTSASDVNQPRSLSPGRYLRLRVRDDGPGIPASVMPKIFDPFFTTKAAGNGTGLGLAAAQSIVRGHGGDITADNLAGATGAEFTVLLPASDAALEQVDSTQAAPARTRS